jgi:hypothetical protein
MFEREPEEHEIAPDLVAIERRLSRLTASAPRIDRDRLMFESGQATVARPERPGYIAEPFRLGRYFWPAATSTMTAASLLLATMLIDTRQALQLAQTNQRSIVPAESAAQHSVDVRTAQPQLASATRLAARAPQTGYLGTRFVALTRGVAALDDADVSGIGNGDASPAILPTRKQMLNELLPKSSRTDTPKS